MFIIKLTHAEQEIKMAIQNTPSRALWDTVGDFLSGIDAQNIWETNWDFAWHVVRQRTDADHFRTNDVLTLTDAWAKVTVTVRRTHETVAII